MDDRTTGFSAALGRGCFVTSADVAERAGVSRSAVSRTFTPGASVSPDVKRRVIAAADELGYRVNRLARGLISSRSNLVGLVCADLDKPFSASLMSRTTQALAQRGMHPLVFEFSADPNDIRSDIQRVLEFRVDAIVIMGGSPPPEVAAECRANGVKLILVNRPVVGEGAYSVVSDDLGGAAAAADRLIDAGLKQLAVAASSSGTMTQTRRIQGFVKRAEERGLSVIVSREDQTTYAGGVANAHELFAGKTARPDGVFCTTDLIAAGFMDTARSTYGLRIPQDLSVIGYDDIPQSDWGSYQLTTLQQSTLALAKAIVQIVRSNDASPDHTTIVPVKLIERASVRA